MRKVNLNIEDIVKKVTQLKGENIEMHINRGRKRIEKLKGIIENIYPSVFVVKITEPKRVNKLSCSFSDVLCGDVKIIDKANLQVE